MPPFAGMTTAGCFADCRLRGADGCSRTFSRKPLRVPAARGTMVYDGYQSRVRMLRRRDILKFGTGAAFASYANAMAQLSLQKGEGLPHAMPHRFPPFEIHGVRPALLALESGIAGYTVERMGKGASLVWLRSDAGQIWGIGVDQRDLEFKFEVFTLAIETIEAMQARVAAWKPPQLPPDMPENFRQLMSTRPELPKPSSEFQPWPFASWRVEVLRRAEYIIENVNPGPTFGNNPNMLVAIRPGQVPPEASATCEVAVALLFTESNGKRLLVGVDWMPYNMIITEDGSEIDEYLRPCERVPLKDYASRLPLSG